MSKALTISDALYAKLEAAARRRGLDSIERLLDNWQPDEEELQHHRETVEQIDALRQRLEASYGEMPDSVELVRKDRAR